GRHAVVEGRHDTSGDVVLGDLRRTHRHADDAVDGEREEHEEIAENPIRDAGLLHDRKRDDEGEEAAGVESIEPSETLDESLTFCSRLGSHGPILPQSSSATPCCRSIRSCCHANTNSMTTNTISEPCAAM